MRLGSHHRQSLDFRVVEYPPWRTNGPERITLMDPSLPRTYQQVQRWTLLHGSAPWLALGRLSYLRLWTGVNWARDVFAEIEAVSMAIATKFSRIIEGYKV